MAPVLKRPGTGMLLWVYGAVYMSGPVLKWTIDESRTGVPGGTLNVFGVDDMVVLADALAYPTPGTADVTQQTQDHDNFTGLCEPVMKHYVAVNVGSSAPSARRGRLAQGLTIETNQNRGQQVVGSARFDNLGGFLADLNTQSASYLGFDVVQANGGGGIVFYVYQVRDRRSVVKMDIDNDLLDSTSSGIAAPKTTVAIVAGQGQQEDRTFLQVTSSASVAAQALWGRRIETFLDQRQTDDPTQLTQAGTKEVQDNGDTTVSLKVTPADSTTMLLGRDWRVGDLVAVVVDDQPLDDVVTEAIISVSSDGVDVGATVGDPVGFDWEAAVTDLVTSHSRRLDSLERNVEPLTLASASDVTTGTSTTTAVTPAALDGLLPPGTMVMTAVSTAPNGWLLCQGQSVSRSQYASLFAAIGTQYGSANGSSFNLPNMQGRVPVGQSGGEGEFNTMGETGGEKYHTLTVGEMPSHSHTQKLGTYDDGNWTGNSGTIQNPPADGPGSYDGLQTGSTGGNGSHNNLQPYLTVNYIIKW